MIARSAGRTALHKPARNGEVDPRKYDLFCVMVEQMEEHKESSNCPMARICYPRSPRYSAQPFARDHRTKGKFVSFGKLDSLLDQDLTTYTNVFIDESHWFRTEANQTCAVPP
jgi:hypothetical protein